MRKLERVLMVVAFRNQLSQMFQLTLPRTSRVDEKSQLCAWAIDRSPIVA